MRIRDGKKIGSWIEKIRILDGKNSDSGSRINVPDPQHWVMHNKRQPLLLSVPQKNWLFYVTKGYRYLQKDSIENWKRNYRNDACV
jgi:hypothetical protein